jgi:hypothetical protein
MRERQERQSAPQSHTDNDDMLFLAKPANYV